ncbi:ArsR/SmtB family transcription factor [Bacillus sp. Au-Bac7]|uniref:ArsR/SmtB family transcription factor n=1 Tax=Bacillus sp. Au-Bac7 TaxID=2906458 RepID=UPI001E567F4C|nr:ArsR family transcriptional regulator [Bacillus sp. Au-Bac7]MCE4051863.1 ArsR family transcriptional regulator [Bacillus sp. Au-Bac7]
MLHMNNINDINQLLLVAKALGNPIRLEILTILSAGEDYVSQLARKLEISRAVLYLHLQKLEEANLVYSDSKISSDGKALKYYYINTFTFLIDNNLLKELEKQNTNFKEI